MLPGPLTGIYDPSGTGRVLFAFFAAIAENARTSTKPPSKASTPPPATVTTADAHP
jgi:hypothetical protein